MNINFFDCTSELNPYMLNCLKSIAMQKKYLLHLHIHILTIFFAYTFDTYFIKNSILRVPAASIDSYKASEPWNSFGKIVALTE